MEWKNEWKPLALIVAIFLVAFYLPVGILRFDNAIKEALYLVKWYAREHVLLCLIPALFIAGAIVEVPALIGLVNVAFYFRRKIILNPFRQDRQRHKNEHSIGREYIMVKERPGLSRLFPG